MLALNFRKVTTNAADAAFNEKGIYSEAPKTGRPVWQTGHIYVRISACPAIGRPVVINLSGYRTD